ncbi:SITS-binding protein-like isoform X2 [Acipenser oxyrinchus oxyrinchus]|uniref:SITS-binding protein-like isoform X2 n=1 Tax=Acipenser oxyrinchus oxyrinchus TaxID=40147 RepID=A0AAD8D326_ACIOX|nr:SITS-binding protein-like isoform X2 [Acipenser oxyrinchus oxyrinchus]
MPHTRTRNPSPIPEVTWDSGLKEMNETWKGAVACLGVAIFFVMTIGIIYWQVVDQPNKNWILKGSFSGLIWDRRTHSLIIQTLTEDKTFVEIDVGNFPALEVPFVKNLCWLNKTEFCYTWDSIADLKISLESEYSPGTECYSIQWIRLHCQVDLKDCFSMDNISWYGGAGVRAQNWPINNVNIALQPFVVSNLRNNPTGFGSVLERYFLGSSGVALFIAQDIPVHISIDSQKHFCLQTPLSTELVPLQYMVCVGNNIKTVHQEVGSQLSELPRELPNTHILRLPFWKLLANADSGAKVERELRTFFNRLKRHKLGEGVISINEHSTTILSDMDHESFYGRKKSTLRHIRDLPHVKLLNISISLSPYTSVDTRQFQTSLQEGREDYWLSLPSKTDGYLAPLLTKWKGKFSVKLNITNHAAVNWFLDKVSSLQAKLGVEYITLEGGEGNPFTEQALEPPKTLAGDEYISLFAEIAAKIGNSSIITAGTRSNHLPLFVRMSPLQSDWSYSGIKGIIPSILHYSLLGYNFFIPDAVGGSLSSEFVTDEELFIRWLQIATFLPVISFRTPPWVCGDRVLNLTRSFILKHQDSVVPLIIQYAEEWASQGRPVFRPVWWISPDDPVTYTIDDEFLIGDEVLVAPVTERGEVQRDIYLPGSEYQWMDTNNGKVFDGGTLLENYSVPLEEVAVFQRRSS